VPTSFLYALTVFGWSTSWLPLSWQVTDTATPELSVFWRFVIAAPIMWLIAWRLKMLQPVSWRFHPFMILLGMCLFSTNFTLFYYGSTGVASGLLAVIFASAAFVNVMLEAVRVRRLPQPVQIIATIIGVGGVAIMFWPEIQASDAALTSLAFCFCGTIFFCTGNMISAHLQRQHIPVLTANSWGMVWGAVLLGLFNLIHGNPFIPELDTRYVSGLLWLAVFSSVLAFSAYLTLVGRIGAGKAGYATVIFPVFALLISSLFEGFVWHIYAFIGIAMVMFGNVLMIRSR